MEAGKLKGLLGIAEGDTSRDLSLEFVIDDVTETILNYCNLEELPTGLTNTAYRMAIDLYRYDRPGDPGAPVTVASISEGDISTSFTSAADALNGGMLKDYQGQLNRYRKLRW
ncbi:hypothetical protein H8S75_30995 [Hungatella sp. L12]|uniref:Phage gp6-like head-tail connector protein n=1 Tax=Hungatella hominis TaxID=2763050 RepID=A0ABR7HGQ7_9FIRM|nr:hypothetical protein [Hungatella hominis]MBC5712337.1 hypothetical protein [Hungatella hominis]